MERDVVLLDANGQALTFTSDENRAALVELAGSDIGNRLDPNGFRGDEIIGTSIDPVVQDAIDAALAGLPTGLAASAVTIDSATGSIIGASSVNRSVNDDALAGSALQLFTLVAAFRVRPAVV